MLSYTPSVSTRFLCWFSHFCPLHGHLSQPRFQLKLSQNIFNTQLLVKHKILKHFQRWEKAFWKVVFKDSIQRPGESGRVIVETSQAFPAAEAVMVVLALAVSTSAASSALTELFQEALGRIERCDQEGLQRMKRFKLRTEVPKLRNCPSHQRGSVKTLICFH